MQEPPVRPLGQEDPPEKEMATHSSILAWYIPWREEPDGLQSMGSEGVGHNWMNKQQQQQLPFILAQNDSRVPLFCPATQCCEISKMFLPLRLSCHYQRNSRRGGRLKGFTVSAFCQTVCENITSARARCKPYPGRDSSLFSLFSQSEVKWSCSVVSDSLQLHKL